MPTKTIPSKELCVRRENVLNFQRMKIGIRSSVILRLVVPGKRLFLAN